jgi:hypothetical protein
LIDDNGFGEAHAGFDEFLAPADQRLDIFAEFLGFSVHRQFAGEHKRTGQER